MNQRELEFVVRNHPNSGSPNGSPRSAIIDAYYARLLLVDRWTWNRFCRLATFLKLTHYELASLALIPHLYVKKWEDEYIFPVKNKSAYAHAMILTLIESNVLDNYTKDVVKQPFPDSSVYGRPQGS
jgi:hypothetical protein